MDNGQTLLPESRIISDYSPEALFQEMMRQLGVNIEDEHFRGTPVRVVKMYKELLRGNRKIDFKQTRFKAASNPSLVTITDLNYFSLCSHHFLPFFGIAHISYLPSTHILGLSKFARVVRHFAARPQVQERLCAEIADYLTDLLEPRALAVMMTGEHLCMSMRGVKSPNHNTTTSEMRGLFISDSGLKAEFFKVIDITKRR